MEYPNNALAKYSASVDLHCALVIFLYIYILQDRIRSKRFAEECYTSVTQSGKTLSIPSSQVIAS